MKTVEKFPRSARVIDLAFISHFDGGGLSTKTCLPEGADEDFTSDSGIRAQSL